jgi:hypothetical protein
MKVFFYSFDIIFKEVIILYKVKGTLSFEKIQKICNFENGKFISKNGSDYVESLASIFNIANRNDKPFSIEDIVLQPTLNDFNFSGKNDFVYICTLKAKPLEFTILGEELKRSNEKIEVVEFASPEAKRIFTNALGVAYILTSVIEGREHIIKFGQSRTSFKSRLGSYNCGTVNNWRTASTTNIKMLQSMVTTRASLKLYLYDCSDEVITYTWHGVESVPFASSKALAVEDIMLKQFNFQFGHKPLANIQTSATEIL